MYSMLRLKDIGHTFRKCGSRNLFGGKKSDSNKTKKYSDTLNLPRTSFPISMKNAFEREVIIQKDADFANLYKWQSENNNGPMFVLHDGPPYANGKPHVGHAINKILKDITNRYHVLRGDCVHYVPGWDCHGLPIELKALQNHKAKKLTPLQIRDMARKFADTAIQNQMSAFKRWGVMADWDSGYYTFTSQYQANQLDVFYQMYEKGLVYMDVMPVYWSPSSGTALAESELEYNSDHVSTAVYVKFPVSGWSDSLQQFSGEGKRLYAVIWTTTPWTLPANQAICFSDNIRYTLLKDEQTEDMFLCEASFVQQLEAILSTDLTSIASIQVHVYHGIGQYKIVSATDSGSELHGLRYSHPLTNEELPFLHGDHVSADKGTGLVHTAPAHGHDDFQLALKHGITVRSLLDDKSCYTSEAGPSLSGLRISKDTEQAVLKLLGEHVISTSEFKHSYPYDWRTKKPVIIRASRQWFINTQKVKDRAQECLQSVEIIPSSASAMLGQQLDSRTYWCISRQRVWGVPIPVFYHKETHQPLLNKATFEHVRNLISTHGADCWWTMSIEELLPSALLHKYNLGESEEYARGQDILDIWFDSGTSWASVIGAGTQADVYMEGIDQFRGWFQSSLLTSVAIQDQAPYKKLVVHGFTMDEEGRKMSKSLGNVVDPQVVINGGKNKKTDPAYGADVLRWWAAFSSLQAHSTIGSEKLSRMLNDVYEMRKTLRFLLGNISDENVQDLLPYEELLPLDKYMLYKLHEATSQVSDLYEKYEYTKVLQLLDKFCKDEVSRFYANLIKDRCYCGSSEGVPRQSSLTTQFYLLDVITRALAPILPHMAEELYQYYPPGRRKSGVKSLFHTGWFTLRQEWNNPDIVSIMGPAFDIREHLHDVLGSEPSMEFDVIIYSSSLLFEKLHKLQDQHSSSVSPLCEILQTATATLTKETPQVLPDDVQLVNGICNVQMKEGYSCPEKYVMIITDTSMFLCDRCRRFTAVSPNTPCDRCMEIMATGWD